MVMLIRKRRVVAHTLERATFLKSPPFLTYLPPHTLTNFFQLRQHLLVLLVVLGALAQLRARVALAHQNGDAPDTCTAKRAGVQPRAWLATTPHSSSGGGHTFLCWRACAQQRSCTRQKRPMYCAESCAQLGQRAHLVNCSRRREDLRRMRLRALRRLLRSKLRLQNAETQ